MASLGREAAWALAFQTCNPSRPGWVGGGYREMQDLVGFRGQCVSYRRPPSSLLRVVPGSRNKRLGREERKNVALKSSFSEALDPPF